MRGRFAALGLDMASRQQQTPEGLVRFQKAEIEKWWPIIRAANVKPWSFMSLSEIMGLCTPHSPSAQELGINWPCGRLPGQFLLFFESSKV